MRMARVTVSISIALFSATAFADIIIDDGQAHFREATVDLSFSNHIVGWAFTPVQNITVNSLGWTQTVFGVGPRNSRDVGIWQVSSGTLLSTATITPGSAQTSLLTRSESVTPFSLLQGTQYIIADALDADGAQTDFAGTYDDNITQPAGPFFANLVSPLIVFDGTAQGEQNAVAGLQGNEIPSIINPGAGWLGPNFEASTAAVPEPSFSVLAGVACVAGFVWRRRRRDDAA